MKTYVTETEPRVHLLPMNVREVDAIAAEPGASSIKGKTTTIVKIDLSPPEYRGIRLPTYLEVRP